MTAASAAFSAVLELLDLANLKTQKDTQVSPSCKLRLTCLPAKTLKVPIKLAKVS